MKILGLKRRLMCCNYCYEFILIMLVFVCGWLVCCWRGLLIVYYHVL